MLLSIVGGVFLLTLIASLFVAIRYWRHGKAFWQFTPLQFTMIVLFMIAFIGHLFSLRSCVPGGVWGTISYSLLFSVQIFLGGMDYNWWQDVIAPNLPVLFIRYQEFTFALAPFLTLGAVLTLIRDFFDRMRIHLRWADTVYVFSCRNEDSMATAQSLVRSDTEKKKKLRIIFTNTDETAGENYEEWNSVCRRIGAVCLDSDCISFAVSLRPRRKDRYSIRYFFMDSDEMANVEQALKVIEQHREDEQVSVYVRSHSLSGEQLLDNADKGRVRVRRINEIQSAVYHDLEQGLADPEHDPFHAAREENGTKQLSYLILGAGAYGMEMLKAILWCGQMDGYELSVDLVDRLPDLENRMNADYPGLMSHSVIRQPGMANYALRIHSGMELQSTEFTDLLTARSPTHVFISVGDDGANVEAALRVRMLLARQQKTPQIIVVTRSEEVSEIVNRSGENYPFNGMRSIGRRSVVFDAAQITADRLEQLSLQVHCMYCGKENPNALSAAERSSFENSEYNRRSSMSSGLHALYKKHCGIDLCSERAAVLEHQRWALYLYTEGYCHAPKKNISARVHCDLIPYEELSEPTRDYDRRIQRKMNGIPDSLQ